jgi:hypothetical protein
VPRPQAVITALLALLIVVPVTLAHASPPDQNWLAGVYDQADFDDVIEFLTSALEATNSTAEPDLGPLLLFARKPYRVPAPCPVAVFVNSPPLRAPPTA